MSALTVRRVLASVSVPQRLLLASTVVYALVFLLVIAFGQPGLGIGGGFYLAIVLAALATDGLTGAVAGAVALGLYQLGEVLGGRRDWPAAVSTGSAVRLVTYVAVGVAVGLFATKARGLLAESFRVLDDLLVLAHDAAARRGD